MKDKKGMRSSAILNKFLMLHVRSGLELTVCPQRFRKSSVFVYSYVHRKQRERENSPISNKKNWVSKSKFGYVESALNVKIQYQNLHLRKKKKNEKGWRKQT